MPKERRLESGRDSLMTSRTWPGIVGWAIVALVALLGVAGAAARPGGILLGVPNGLQAAVVIAAAVALGAKLGGPAGAAALGFLPIPLFLLLAPVPGIRALSGPPLLALALAGLAAAFVTARWRPPRALFFPAVLAVYAIVAARAQLQVGPQGDEPHYLMVADSILRDHDVALQDDYAARRYERFFDGTLEPHYRVRGKHGEIFSLHAVGLSLLLLPAYAAGGYPAASFFMALLAALLAREIRELVRAWSGSDGLAEGTGWLVALSPPLVHYAGLVFTEIPAALAVAVALRRGRDPGTASRLDGVAWVLAIVALPWLNVRYAVVAVTLVLFALAARPPRRVVAILAGSLALSAIALALWHHHLYGFFDPRRVYGRRPELSLSLIPEGIQGLLLDQEFGLLAYAPVFVLVAPGLVRLLRTSRRLGAAAVVLLLVVILTAGAWPMWRGGFNPPARFLVPVLPVLALCVAAALRGGAGAAAALLMGWSLWTGLAGGWDPRLVHRDRDGTAPLFRERSGAEEWTRLLPAYVLPEEEADRHRLACVWAIALGLAAAATVRRRAPAPTPLGMGVATVAFMAAAVVASRVSDRKTEGRDAVRLVGRPALATPGWQVVRSAAAEWGPGDLGWGPAYEPHRHPDGAVLGGRLAIPPGSYRLEIVGQDLAPQLAAPDLVVVPQPAAAARSVPLERTGAGWLATFDVQADESAVTLEAGGGGPFVLGQLGLRPSTFSAADGPNNRRERPR
jgi:hypothetical protein